MPTFCAVIGNPVMHSLSPFIHQAFATQTHLLLDYRKIQGDEQSFEQQVSTFFKQQGKGLNVTLPFKQRAFAMADVLSERCRHAGAANTLWVSNNQLHADNTDGVGLIRDLTRHITLNNAKIAILGAGGAARGILQPLLDAQPQQVWVANHSIAPLNELQAAFPSIRCMSLAELNGEFELVINATSVGLCGTDLALPPSLLASQPFCYDLVYQQSGKTPFVQYAQSAGCRVVDGIGMLVEQAAESFYLWHGIKPDTNLVLQALRPVIHSG